MKWSILQSLSFISAILSTALMAAPRGQALEEALDMAALRQPQRIEAYDRFSSPDEAFAHYLHHFKPDWKPKDEQDWQNHFDAFTRNLASIREMDADIKSQGGHLEVGVTMFTDMDNAEFQEKVLLKTPPLQKITRQPLPVTSLIATQSLPLNLDWRDKGVVGPVKNQWFCGSCYIFSAVGTIESNYAISHNCSSISLSEQQVLDCNGLSGCDGGWPDKVFEYAENKGLCPHSDYHYWNFQKKCDEKTVSECKPKVFVSGYKQLPYKDDQALLEALQDHTVSIAMDASSLHFQFYIGGIFKSKHCPKDPELNHALEVVGYGVDKHGHKYWEVKNSWGKLWGFGGYIKVDRDSPDTCGISQQASYPIVAK